jgi:hypothetical protein
MLESILFMTDRGFALQYFSKDAHCLVGGAIIQRDRIRSLNWFTGKADALAAANVQKAANEERYHLCLDTYLWIEPIVSCAATVQMHVHLTLFRLLEN